MFTVVVSAAPGVCVCGGGEGGSPAGSYIYVQENAGKHGNVFNLSNTSAEKNKTKQSKTKNILKGTRAGNTDSE